MLVPMLVLTMVCSDDTGIVWALVSDSGSCWPVHPARISCSHAVHAVPFGSGPDSSSQARPAVSRPHRPSGLVVRFTRQGCRWHTSPPTLSSADELGGVNLVIKQAQLQAAGRCCRVGLE